MKPDRKCPICGGEFDLGSFPAYAARLLSWFKGTKVPFLKFKDFKPVSAYRCKS
ncbi:MAG: hypothetical protein NT141_04315 [candidate division WWE3 bacterium]|nr:hypothetical protein [candidate division WWE3 bacterium]